MTQTPRHGGRTGWIEVISGSMFSGKTDIYEARCRRPGLLAGGHYRGDNTVTSYRRELCA